jgi:Heme/copper-type cytochrome/quinol oxidases, subunit 1
MHNTLWVPGHFHFYLLLGLWAMLFGFMYHVIRTRADEPDSAVDQLGFFAYLAGGLVFSGMLLMAGQASVPRRWAVHAPEWVPYASAASLAAILVVLATILFAVRIVSGLLRAPNVGTAH